MCFFLTIAVPAQHADRIDDVFGRGFQSHPSDNPFVAAALPPGYAARFITRDGCSCGLYARRNDEPADDHTASLRRKYAKRGWSEAKITRAVGQVEARGWKSAPPTPGLRSDVVDRLQTLCQIAGRVALLVHWYSGDVQGEKLSPRRAQPCSCDQLPARAQELDEDELLIAEVPRTG